MSEIKDWILYNKGKCASIIVSALYLLAAFLTGNIEDVVRLAGFLIIPLACIWFGDDMGGWIGFSRAGGPRITQASPGCLVVFVGWVLLLAPLIVGIVSVLSE